MKKFNNGKVIVTDSTVQIKGFLGLTTTVIQKDEISSIDAFGNFFYAIFRFLLVIYFYSGYKMIMGYKLVTIKRRFDDSEISFWLPSNEVSSFRGSI